VTACRRIVPLCPRVVPRGSRTVHPWQRVRADCRRTLSACPRCLHPCARTVTACGRYVAPQPRDRSGAGQPVAGLQSIRAAPRDCRGTGTGERLPSSCSTPWRGGSGATGKECRSALVILGLLCLLTPRAGELPSKDLPSEKVERGHAAFVLEWWDGAPTRWRWRGNQTVPEPSN
jgi:hypothetical protein